MLGDFPMWILCRKRKASGESTNSNSKTPEYTNGVHIGVHNQGHVLDFSIPSSCPKMFDRLDSLKYGSVTKEVEAAINAQKEQVAKFFSRLNQKFPISPYPITSPTSPSPVSQMSMSNPFSKFNSLKSTSVIDLDCEKGDGTILEKNEKKTETERKSESTAIIVIDSDDEDAGENINKIENDVGIGFGSENALPGTQKEGSDFRVPLEQSGMNDQRKQAVPDGNGGAMVLCSQSTLDLALPLIPKEPYWQPQVQYSKVVLQQYPEEARLQDLEVANHVEKKIEAAPPINQNVATYVRKNRKQRSDSGKTRRRDQLQDPLASPMNTSAVCPSDSFSPVESSYPEELKESNDDDLEDLWKDMSLAMEYSKAEMAQEKEEWKEKEKEVTDDDEEDVCEHSFMLRDDLGLVCKICGIIQKKIETIFDFQFKKSTRTSYYYAPHGPKHGAGDSTDFESLKLPQDDFEVAEVAIHPRHLKMIKPHQMEGFNFLVKNLVTDSPSGCILAHAPGSGKTFMLIAFIQSFLAKYPSFRPLIVLPKGILSTWKRELQRWQVEDILLLDFYSKKAEKRSEQLEVLNQWKETRSILFLGYKQFSTIVCGSGASKAATACQEMLLKVPKLLILDEGHTPRNEDTNVLESLAKVETKRKVVLSGTLFQNHVQEVFNIINLVRPKFLQSGKAGAIVKRVLSRVEMGGSRRISNRIVESAFYELVEQTLQNDNAFNRKIRVIEDLRELTKDVLHYYKGDFLDELPGLVDITVMLELSQKQKELNQKLSSYEKFKRTAVGTAMYMHPRLSEISEIAHGDRVASVISAKMDALVESIKENLQDGVKTKFFLNILNLAVAAQEKLLVFSQYIVPLKFLERLLVHTKGWRVGKEIFVISGDSSSDEREWSMDHFNNSSDAKVLFGSIKACGEGISLVGASRVVILDVHLNPSVTRQAIGRAFRPGQTRKVYTYRLVAAGSPEERVHQTSFKKELISKMWFEWSEHCNIREFDLDEVAVESCNDIFLENPAVHEDIKSLYRR
ncbi:DNA repair/recombination protein [Rhynchospora pubera]|uniref:DNA repair/recombination protein n=1 Tax=Rhynchospora pubera TaxID=906938 RepID=A0AAV8HK80_9POAL|nr:DNA repair/recombination protein [Rhynchospora pubera]